MVLSEHDFADGMADRLWPGDHSSWRPVWLLASWGGGHRVGRNSRPERTAPVLGDTEQSGGVQRCRQPPPSHRHAFWAVGRLAPDGQGICQRPPQWRPGGDRCGADCLLWPPVTGSSPSHRPSFQRQDDAFGWGPHPKIQETVIFNTKTQKHIDYHYWSTFINIVVPYTKNALISGLTLVFLPCLTSVSVPQFLNSSSSGSLIGDIIMEEGQLAQTSDISLARASTLALIVFLFLAVGVFIFWSSKKIVKYAMRRRVRR